MSIFTDSRNALMVKDMVAATLREEIISGRLQPDKPIVEAKWGAQLSVAQGSIREAINILASEGFVDKGGGRSARVTKLSEDDVRQIYELRAPLEGLAASILAGKQSEVSDLEQIIGDMGSALASNNVRAFYERDLQFHMRICEKTGNRYLEQNLRRLLVPLFAFVIMRIHGETTEPEHFRRSIDLHKQMLEAIRSGDPFFAEQQVRRTIDRFRDGTREILVKS